MLYVKKKDSISKQNSNHEKQIILLMFPKGEEWHYITLKRLSTLLRKKNSKSDRDFCFVNWLYSFRTKTKLKSHRKVSK